MTSQPEGVLLAGIGESSDAHHISAPQPEGKGAEQSMQMALKDAGIEPQQIDYINLHGTATRLNDQMEALAVDRVFGSQVLASSTKSITGHTLGAAGALEAAICWLVLTESNLLPIHHWDGQQDQNLPPLNLVTSNIANNKILRVLSNSFAFGGNNISLILERV
jgi:3-oxoacyl-[acyl-carrier-protein] synthase-1